jgi:hypothetical protein
LTVFEPLDTDLSEWTETRERVDGDFGIWAVLDAAVSPPRTFFAGESFLLKVKVLLLGRSRFVRLSDFSGCNESFFTGTGPSRDLVDLAEDLSVCFPSLSPTEDCIDPVLDDCDRSSLCVRTKSALTSSFSVRI